MNTRSLNCWSGPRVTAPTSRNCSSPLWETGPSQKLPLGGNMPRGCSPLCLSWYLYVIQTILTKNHNHINIFLSKILTVQCTTFLKIKCQVCCLPQWRVWCCLAIQWSRWEEISLSSCFPGLGRSPGEQNSYPLQYSCLKTPDGQQSLVGCSPWGHTESDTTEQLTLKKVCSLCNRWDSGTYF